MADFRIQARISQELDSWLSERRARMHTDSVHVQGARELELWHTALQAELRRIRLTLAQANCVADILTSTSVDSVGTPVVFSSVADACRLARTAPVPGDEATYSARFGVDEAALMTYLQGLGPTADHALNDAVSRWREGGCDPTREGWAAVGLSVLPDIADTP